MKPPFNFDEGEFYDIENGYFLPSVPCPKGVELVVGRRLSISCMFQVSEVLLAGIRVGVIFYSTFLKENCGGYIRTWLSKSAPATVADTLIKTPQFVLYSYPNRGALVISAKVNKQVNTILEEQ